MDRFLKLYDKGDHPTHGIYKISLDEVADALGFWKGFDCNMRPYYRILHHLTNKYLVENKEFIVVPMDDDGIPCKTRFYTKHAFLLLAMICKKHRKRNWLDNKRLIRDHKNYLNSITGIPATKIIEDSSDDSEKNQAKISTCVILACFTS
jgi:hypothetical protein